MLKENEKLYLLGRNIAGIRREKGYSQNGLADLLYVSREHLAKIETAKRGLSFKLLFKISEVLGVPEKAFFEFNEEILKTEKKK